MLKKINLVPLLLWMSTVLMAGSIIWTLVEALQKTNEGARQKAVFLAFEVLLGLLLIWVPTWIAKLFKLTFPKILYLLFIIFIFCAVYLGTAYGFYGKFHYWDKFLHIGSAAMLGGVGFSITEMIKKDTRESIPPFFLALFASTFALSMGVFWEFYEFSCDSLLGMNLQRFNLSNGVPLTGQAALMDTMGDLFIDMVGAVLMGIYGVIMMRKNPLWLENFYFHRQKIQMKSK